jgi:hypothetical protein
MMSSKAGSKKGSIMGSSKVIDGVVHVWSILDNAWVTLEYWEWVNGR